MLDLTDTLREIDWPDSFYVFWRDGHSELLLRGDGIGITPPMDDPNGIGGLDALIPKKHPKHQHQGGRYINYNEILKIVGVDGTVLFCHPNES